MAKKNTLDTKILGGSLATTGKGTAWVAHWDDDSMYMYDNKGTNIRSVSLASGAGIWDLVVNRSGDVVVCTTDNKVSLFTKDGKVVTLVETAHFSPKGVCLTEREEVVVCMGDQKRKNHIAVCAANGGKKIKEIAVQDKQGKQLLTDPFRIVKMERIYQL